MKNIANLMELLPKISGSKGSFTLQGKILKQALKTAPEEVQKLASKVFTEVSDPIVEVAYKVGSGAKAASNYSIAGLKFRDGKKVLGNAAVSVTNPGTPGAVVKARTSIGPNGEIVRANGFIDGGKYPDIDDISSSFSRKNGVINSSTRINDAAGYNAAINESALTDLTKDNIGSEFVKAYTQRVRNMQNNILGKMVDYRNLVSGKEIKRFPSAITLKKAEPASMTKKIVAENFDSASMKNLGNYIKK